MKTLIKNGRVVDPSQQLDAVMDILVEDGKLKLWARILPKLLTRFLMQPAS